MKYLWVTILIAQFLPYSANAKHPGCPMGLFTGEEKGNSGEMIYFCKRGERNEKGEMVYAQRGPIKIFLDGNLIREGQLDDSGVPTGTWKTYVPDDGSKIEYQVNAKSEMHGNYVRYYENGQIRAKGRYENNKPIGKFNFFKIDGTCLAEGTVEETKPVVEAYQSELKKKLVLEAKAKKENDAAEEKKLMAKIKANWVEKKKGNITTFTDKSTKLNWTGFLGSGNWVNAKRKCITAKMNLPKLEQLQVALENGLSSFVENPLGLFWTSSEKGNVNDPKLSMMLDNGEAFAVATNGQAVPQSVLEDLGVVCVK